MNITDKVKLFTFIPIESAIYIVENFYNLEKVLRHLIYLRNNKV